MAMTMLEKKGYTWNGCMRGHCFPSLDMAGISISVLGVDVHLRVAGCADLGSWRGECIESNGPEKWTKQWRQKRRRGRVGGGEKKVQTETAGK